MPSRLTHSKIAQAFASGTPMRKRGKNAETGANGTMYEVRKDGDRVAAYYWGTPVVTLDLARDVVTFKNNGHQTVTTKALINAVLDALGIQARLYQTDHVWRFHRTGQSPIEFQDGMTLKISPNLRDLLPPTGS